VSTRIAALPLRVPVSREHEPHVGLPEAPVALVGPLTICSVPAPLKPRPRWVRHVYLGLLSHEASDLQHSFGALADIVADHVALGCSERIGDFFGRNSDIRCDSCCLQEF
jgi:hypothetical protein